MKRLKEFAKAYKLNPIVPMTELEGKEIVIQGFRTGVTRFGDALFIDFTGEDGKSYTTVTSSELIRNACYEAKEAGAFPVAAKFVKKDNYWTIV